MGSDATWYLALAGDLREEGVARRLAAEELAHHRGLLLLPTLGEDGVAIARPGLRVQQRVAEPREHVERHHLRPHVAVIPRGISTHEMAEVRRLVRARQVPEKARSLDPGPERLHRLRLHGKRHVQRRVLPLAAEADGASELARALEPLDLLARQHRAFGADLAEECQRLLAPHPLLEHLRRRLDEVAL